MSTPHTHRRRDAEQNRHGILAAAVIELAMDPNASVDTIARAAGLTRRALYGHFEDREALVTAVIDAGAARFNAIAGTVTEADPPLALAHLAEALWEEAEHVHAAAALALNERLAPRTVAALAPVRERLLAICRRGHRDGVLRQDIPAELTARLVEEAARGVITHIDPESASAHRLATRAVLSAAGLGWAEADALLVRTARTRVTSPAAMTKEVA